jgi:hypothetical protein
MLQCVGFGFGVQILDGLFAAQAVKQHLPVDFRGLSHRILPLIQLYRREKKRVKL